MEDNSDKLSRFLPLLHRSPPTQISTSSLTSSFNDVPRAERSKEPFRLAENSDYEIVNASYVTFERNQRHYVGKPTDEDARQVGQTELFGDNSCLVTRERNEPSGLQEMEGEQERAVREIQYDCKCDKGQSPRDVPKSLSKALIDRLYSFPDDRENEKRSELGNACYGGRRCIATNLLTTDKNNKHLPHNRCWDSNSTRALGQKKESTFLGSGSLGGMDYLGGKGRANDIEKLISMSTMFCNAPSSPETMGEDCRSDLSSSIDDVDTFVYQRRYTLPLVDGSHTNVSGTSISKSRDAAEDPPPIKPPRAFKYSIESILGKGETPSNVEDGIWEEGVNKTLATIVEDVKAVMPFATTSDANLITDTSPMKFEVPISFNSTKPACSFKGEEYLNDGYDTNYTRSQWMNESYYQARAQKVDSLAPFYNASLDPNKNFQAIYHPYNNYLFNTLAATELQMYGGNRMENLNGTMCQHPYPFYLFNLFNYTNNQHHGYVPRVSAPFYAPHLQAPPPPHTFPNNLHKKISYPNPHTFNATLHSVNKRSEEVIRHQNHNRPQLGLGSKGETIKACTEPRPIVHGSENDDNGNNTRPTKKRGSKIQFFNDWRLERDKCGRFTKQNNYTSHRKELLEKLRMGITLRCKLCGQTFHSLKGYIDHENKLPCMRRSTGSGKKRGRPRKMCDDLGPSSLMTHPYPSYNSKTNIKKILVGAPTMTHQQPRSNDGYQEVRNPLVFGLQPRYLNPDWLTSSTTTVVPKNLKVEVERFSNGYHTHGNIVDIKRSKDQLEISPGFSSGSYMSNTKNGRYTNEYSVDRHDLFPKSTKLIELDNGVLNLCTLKEDPNANYKNGICKVTADTVQVKQHL